MEVEEGSFVSDDNRPSAAMGVDALAYFARKRSVSMRSVCVLVLGAASLSIWTPALSLVLAGGGACGVINVLLVMRNNERLLVGGRSRTRYGLSNTVRLLAVGMVPALAATHHPWWYMLVAVAGFFTPLAVYALQLRREFLAE